LRGISSSRLKNLFGSDQMKKQTVIVIVCLAVLAAAVGILLYLSRDTISDGRTAQEEKSITFTENGEEVSVLYWEDITALESETFEAVLRSSSARPRTVTYEGVEIHTLMAAAGIDISGKSLEFIGADAYAASVTVDEATEEGEIYVVYSADGQQLGSREEGGDGPYQLVIVNDHFSQRWCKYLSEVVVK
jgi:hypothetical protein